MRVGDGGIRRNADEPRIVLQGVAGGSGHASLVLETLKKLRVCPGVIDVAKRREIGVHIVEIGGRQNTSAAALSEIVHPKLVAGQHVCEERENSQPIDSDERIGVVLIGGNDTRVITE